MLAQALGIDENRYTRYERAEVEPDLALLVRICTVLGLTPNDLLGFPTEGGADSAGFAEPGQQSIAGGSTPSPHAGSKYAGLSTRALAWHAACLLTVDAAGVNEDPLERLRHTSQVFAEIEADPFAFAVHAAGSPEAKALPPDRQATLVAVINEMLAGIRNPKT
jgi:transcriptional regulator with XRE-family HTH domain